MIVARPSNDGGGAYISQRTISHCLNYKYNMITYIFDIIIYDISKYISKDTISYCLNVMYQVFNVFIKILITL